ncbi:XrtA/PEP-CTERM system exopolysaccharide export protein [Marinimicrobium sp. ARAG 43.8]|uniref:XrtA/PEP-CTERM system exopolysaccharide export protein n=1 Tax=Marinimicrobium sp. ARAG 43.8 TaxID=3418719 RepID=UPI003CE8626C
MNTALAFFRTSFGLMVLSLLLLSGCSTKPVEPPPTGSGTLQEYRIGVGDALRINVWRNAELSSDVPVRPDGMISLPLVGDVMAAGRTTEELSAALTTALNEYVRNPQVTVIVTNPSSSDFQRRVRITGAVQSPQSIAYREGMTVLDLVLLAGGPNEFASANKAKLYRRINGDVKVYPIHLDDLINRGRVETNYSLQPSDIVTVPERAF